MKSKINITIEKIIQLNFIRNIFVTIKLTNLMKNVKNQ